MIEPSGSGDRLIPELETVCLPPRTGRWIARYLDMKLLVFRIDKHRIAQAPRGKLVAQAVPDDHFLAVSFRPTLDPRQADGRSEMRRESAGGHVALVILERCRRILGQDVRARTERLSGVERHHADECGSIS